jgi:membrane protein DedA with SNARE-associated domain
MLVEGPVVTLFASFAASFEVFNIYTIIILSFLGNILPDLIFFHIGKYSRKSVVEKLIQKIGLTKQRILRLEANLKEHTKKAIIFIKVTPMIPIPGIMLAGFLKIPFKRFFSISIVVDFFAVLIFSAVGYYSGVAGLGIVKYFRLEKFIIPIIFLLIVFIYWLSKKIYRFVIKNIKNNEMP